MSKSLVAAWTFIAMAIFLVGPYKGAHAADVLFTAEFTPSPSNPTHDKFVNTTPQSGYCAWWPQYCNGIFSVSIPIGDVNYSEMLPDKPGRAGAYFRVPSKFIPIEVAHEQTGARETLQFRISSLSATQMLKSGAEGLTGGGHHRELWHGSSWVYAPEGCGGTGMAIGNDYKYSFAWTFYESTSSCTKTPRFFIPVGEMSLENISVGYELVTPKPLRMRSGTYRGTHVFTVGPGGDFDFGDKATVAASTVEVEFQLFVHHLFELRIPPGSDRAVLEPPGGWGAWLNRGRPPVKLYRDVPFWFSTSTDFSATLTCTDSAPVSGRCRIRDDKRDASAALDVSISLPRMKTENGLPVQRLPLSANQTLLMVPDAIAFGSSAQLHIEVGQEEVANMLKHAGGRFRGNITVVFDSEPAG